MKKRILAVILGLVLCLTLLPVSAFAGGSKNTITFDLKGHGTAIASQEKEDGEKVDRPKDPTAEGWYFEGWYTDSDCELHPYNFDEAVWHDLTLYAKWSDCIAITEIDISGIKTPVIGGTAGDSLKNLAVSTAHVSFTDGSWRRFNGSESGEQLAPEDTFLAGEHYWYLIELEADPGYYFPEDWQFGEYTGTVTASEVAYDMVLPRSESDPGTGTKHHYICIWGESVSPEAPTYNVMVISDINGTVAGGGQHDAGETVSLSAVPKTGYRLSSISAMCGDVPVSIDETLSFVMPEGNVTVTASFEEIPKVFWNVTYDSNGGSDVSKEVVEEGYCASCPTDPVKPGYSFDGWYTDTALSVPYDFTDPVTKDITLYAKWTEDPSAVLYNITVIGGGSAYLNGARTTVITKAAKGTLLFIGFDEPAAGKYVRDITFEGTSLDIFDYDGGVLMPEKDAVFEIITADRQTCTVDLTSGTGSMPKEAYVFNHPLFGTFYSADELKDVAVDLDGSGKCDVILNWSFTDAEVTVEKHPDCDITGEYPVLTAETNTPYIQVNYKFSEPAPVPVNCTVTFDMKGHGTQIAAQTVADGSKAIMPTDPSASGYTFKGWYTDSAFKTKFDFNTAIHEDMTLYAKWVTNSVKPNDHKTPRTGDNSNMFLWIALLLVSGGALVGTTVFGKKKKS